ncbi:cytochrome P450 [Paracoccus rhizosphaerae]|uniref:Cytochrome P450 n=1 Tax=Paracoccus rhizosphaerae TaxID=1133347 RepID=A0ABV6CMM8_9RHOB|nr:cytochrome P450 [Paracoccus rhizosphaerae]
MTVPRAAGFDQTLAFLREGYRFIGSRCDALRTDIFRTRIMLRRVTCVRGEAAARMFYGGGCFTRRGAMPPTVLRLLQDKGSVQMLDGAAHHHRKTLFIELLMGSQAERDFLYVFEAEWHDAILRWSRQPRVVLLDEVNLVLTRAACRWTRVPLDDVDPQRLCRELSSMIEYAGHPGPRMVAALARRRSAERFVATLLKDLRAQDGWASPAARIANFRDADCQLLSLDAATVELLNILRPIVAIGRFVIFAALALHDHPNWRTALQGGGDDLYQRFAEEVRRLYPFFPVIGGIALCDFDWNGHRFSKGDWVLLDLHGTNHDPCLFPDPMAFDPNRAPDWRDQGFDFVPQGGGKVAGSHRCPGEQLTVATIRSATRMLVERMDYAVPPQDLSMPLNRLPARQASGMILQDVAPR